MSGIVWTEIEEARENIKEAEAYRVERVKDLEVVEKLIGEFESGILDMQAEIDRRSEEGEDVEDLERVKEGVERVYVKRLKKTRKLLLEQINAALDLIKVSRVALSDYEIAESVGKRVGVERIEVEGRVREMRRASHVFQGLAELRG